MLTFYIYRLVSDGKIAGPAIIVQCENDQEALEFRESRPNRPWIGYWPK